MERKREENLRMNNLRKEKDERSEEIGEDLGERETFWGKKETGGKRARDLWKKQPGKR